MSNQNQKPGKSTRDKLKRLLTRSVPAALPWVGNIWKDTVDEFTDNEVDHALQRLEAFAEIDIDEQRKILSNW